MTMRTIAEQLGVSLPTLYRRLKAEGVNVAELRDDSGALTAEGASVIASVFDGAASDTAIQEALQGRAGAVNQSESGDVASDTVRAAVLAARLEAAEATIQRLDNEVQRLQGERDRLLSMLETEQRQRVQLLTDGNNQRRGLFGLFKRSRGTDTSGSGAG